MILEPQPQSQNNDGLLGPIDSSLMVVDVDPLGYIRAESEDGDSAGL